jgi:Tfp pilus assembly protein PilF
MIRFASRTQVGIAISAGVVLASFLLGACDRGAKAGDAAPAAADSGGSQSVMQTGLDQLYKNNDPAAAVVTFRDVLKQNPTHYGARFQLAKALDLAGSPAEARPVWEAVLGAAEGIKDTATAATARTRLAQPDTVSQVAMMGVGLSLLNAQNNPSAAADQFKKVLERNPKHYGAHFQLALALDRAGKQDEARPHWQEVLTMAEAIKDQKTADAARAALAAPRKR